MAKSNQNRIVDKIFRLVAPLNRKARIQSKAIDKIIEQFKAGETLNEQYSEFKIVSNSPALFNSMKEAVAPHVGVLNALFIEMNKFKRPMDEALDQYLINGFNCQLHGEFNLNSIGFAIDLTEVNFFELFSTVYEYIIANYKKPIATINKLKQILHALTIEQRIFLIKTIISRLESTDEYNNEDHPQLGLIFDHLYIEQDLALDEFNSTTFIENNPLSQRKDFFNSYLQKKTLSKPENQDMSDGRFGKESIVEAVTQDASDSVLTDNNPLLIEEPIYTYFNKEGKMLLPYIKATFSKSTPTRSGLAPFLIAADQLDHFEIKVVVGGDQMRFINALNQYLGSNVVKLGAFNAAMSKYNRAKDIEKIDQINNAKMKILEITKGERHKSANN